MALLRRSLAGSGPAHTHGEFATAVAGSARVLRGIGLKIAAEVAHAHGGSLDYGDRAGGGAVFRLLLRREDRPVDRAASAAAAGCASRGGG